MIRPLLMMITGGSAYLLGELVIRYEAPLLVLPYALILAWLWTAGVSKVLLRY